MLVVGSFTQEANAKKYFNQLRTQGTSPYTYYDSGRRVHYVHIGRFDDKAAARAAIKANTNSALKPWIKTIK